ncbi:hypothetical protein Tco_1342649 [Tanacetum coccineum]
MKDEAESNLNDEENDFMLDNSFRDETLEELTAAVMAQIQPANDNGVHEHKNHRKRKTVINTSNDDQIDSNIDDPYVENNGRSDEHDSTAHYQYHDLLQKELETCKEWVKTFESKTIQCSKYKETCEELEREIRADKDTIERILKEKDKIKNDFFKTKNEKIIIQRETQLAKKVFKKQENRYLEDIVDLEEKLGSHDRIVYKICQSIQTIHMLGKTLNKVYDPFLKAGIGQKTYAYGDVRSENQDLLMIISELKNKLKAFEKGKGVNTKFDKYVTSRKLLCVTPFPNNIAVQAKKVSKQEDKTYRSKPVTSHSTPKNEQKQKKNANVIARGMYKLPTQESHTQVSTTNMNVSNYTGVESSNSVRRLMSKDTKLKNRVLKNTNDKSSSAHVQKVSSSVRIDYNKREAMNSIVCQSNVSVLKTKIVDAVNDGSNIVYVSYGKDVFMLSHEKCVACYALSKDYRVKRDLFTTLVEEKSKNLGATSVVAKSRLSVAKTPTSTNKVSSAVSLSPYSNQSRTLSTYMKNKITTSRKW